jgi:hypothetical protein
MSRQDVLVTIEKPAKTMESAAAKALGDSSQMVDYS